MTSAESEVDKQQTPIERFHSIVQGLERCSPVAGRMPDREEYRRLMRERRRALDGIIHEVRAAHQLVESRNLLLGGLRRYRGMKPFRSVEEGMAVLEKLGFKVESSSQGLQSSDAVTFDEGSSRFVFPGGDTFYPVRRRGRL